jgi:phosphate ABC transporter phosphate-binding protein
VTVRTRIKRISFRRIAPALAGVLALGVATTATPADAAGYVPISGAGSTWSANAVDQWRKNVEQYDITVNYQSTGSSDGRNQFKQGTIDYAVSEIPYGLTDGGVRDEPPTRGYAYMPIVAGGTSIMYNLKIGSAQVTNLRLSGATVAKIFTGVITKWDDPAIKADNPGLALPARRIVPVVRSDGSGTSAQFTQWMTSQHADIWNAYCKKAGKATCGQTSQYPSVGGSGFVAQSGSLGVSGYVSQGQNIGSITYVEYSYALNTGFPVAKVLNKSGYYVEPTPSNTAVGLTKAVVNTNAGSADYLTANLQGVYTNKDKRAYPLSSYSYMIVPTEVKGTFSEDKGRTLGEFGYYFLCEGQQQAPDLGYSPLPINLVQAGLDQVRRIPGVEAQKVDIAKCNNPTFSPSGENLLIKNAPYPSECDKLGATQCEDGTGGAKKKKTRTNGAGGDESSTGGASVAGSTDGDGTGADPGAAETFVDPGTGELVVADAGTGSDVTAVAQTLQAEDGWGTQQAAMGLAGLLLVTMVVAPPLVARRFGDADATDGADGAA